MMDLFAWIEKHLAPIPCDSEQFIYDDMASQSGRSLPIIYQPFDAADQSHWTDRGSLFDYLWSVDGHGKRLLDFGPGDGWPSLIVAPFAAEVVGVDGSPTRVSVCADNARRLGISNARFIHVPPGSPLPFDDGTFDGVMAASSVEQTPEPMATIAELIRVLRPSGRLRINYESLSRYRNGRERDVWLSDISGQRSRLILFDRRVQTERARQYGLTFSKSREELTRVLSGGVGPLAFSALTVRHLEALLPSLIDARVCDTTHPSGKTLARWFHDLGVREVKPTHSGSVAAGMLFDGQTTGTRPADIEGVDRLLEPLVKLVSTLAAPLDSDPMITVTK
jgi:SAM-dependent methyltransferase